MGAPQSSATYLYWADNRPDGGYHEHDDSYGSAVIGTYYHTFIYQVTPTAWSVQIGSFVGSSTANPGPSKRLQAGTETNISDSNYAQVYMHAYNMKFIGGAGDFSGGWSYALGTDYPVQIPSGYATVVLGGYPYSAMAAAHEVPCSY
jgi:hypothetical protein